MKKFKMLVHTVEEVSVTDKNIFEYLTYCLDSDPVMNDVVPIDPNFEVYRLLRGLCDYKSRVRKTLRRYGLKIGEI